VRNMKIKVGEIIKAKREEQNISLVAFAKELDISPGYLSQIENGVKTNPNLDIILRIIQRLDIDVAMLLGVESSEENYLVKIPSLLKFILAKERNSRVLENQDILRKFWSLCEKTLETSYLLDDEELYKMFLEDLLNQAETTLKRYMGMQVIMQSRQGIGGN
jgi:transcriptional regulator with XRE-family HTH domain